MPETLSAVWATPGLPWLLLAIALAGIVRGFTGFGTALIFVPVAGIFLPPEIIVGVITLTGIASTSALLPRAWSQADRREVGILALAALVTVPLGLWLMARLDPVSIRWVVAAVGTVTLAALITGWRFSGQVGRPMLVAIGALAGVIGGLTGLTGPVVILFYLAGQAVAQSVRANTILFLAALDVVIVVNLLLRGTINGQIFLLALILAVPYFITSLFGQSLFDPRHERLYRWAAYAVIGLAVVSGLPIWGTEG
ncbi:Sulfite exporter TauE/SafE [Roseovarius mucosus DSM 17069]|uniref:Probable membrane transporter protein n=1 Tax=Roseovarius mucosus DSM 17069 TaxID=1288298 RepID=A0A0A0HK26_9RHOB|nr:sulfite exporter TauE/SafE family protein [Roseovarius mucosus]KGM87004.1 Sulfite exporter TauE/SafE [Roseovarius mucosus DSM 17069]MAN99132.1 sulfite exporter TauE/SafE family protein [Roseovarius sp.]